MLVLNTKIIRKDKELNYNSLSFFYSQKEWSNERY